MSSADNTARNARIARLIALSSYAMLLLTIAIALLGRTGLDARGRVLTWVVQSLPLLLFLPGLSRGAWKSYLWLCFVLLIYFMYIIERVFATDGGLLDVVQLVLIGALFVAATLYARWRQRELAAIRY